jgi:uncharacterized protein (TIGR02453 family)
MITQQTLLFLSQLGKNNNKPWFDKHKSEYQYARQNFLDVTSQLITKLAAMDIDIRFSDLQANKCMMRINRDIRFSKDKTPYKTNFFAFINREGKKSPFAGYYISVKPGASFIGGGIYMPESQVLQKIRRAIDGQFDTWQEITLNNDLLTHFPEGIKPSGQLIKPPRGYDATNPAIEYLKYKGYYTQRFISDEQLQQVNFLNEIVTSYQKLLHLINFINAAIK